VLVFSSI